MNFSRPALLLIASTTVLVSAIVPACVSNTPPATGTDAGHDSGDNNAADSGSSDTGSPIIDSGSQAEAEAAPGFLPTDVTGLHLWLDASKGVTSSATTGAISEWADQSGTGNNAFQVATTNQPFIQTNAVHGLPSVHFDSASDTYVTIAPTPATLLIGTGDFVILEVTSFTNTPSANNNTGYGALLVPSPSSGFFANDPAIPNGAIRAQLPGGVVDTTGTSYNDGVYHYVAMRRTGTSLEARGDGTASTPVTITGAGDITAGTIGFFIGGRIVAEGANQALEGNIAEVIVVTGTVSDADMGKLELYVKTKYDLL